MNKKEDVESFQSAKKQQKRSEIAIFKFQIPLFGVIGDWGIINSAVTPPYVSATAIVEL